MLSKIKTEALHKISISVTQAFTYRFKGFISVIIEQQLKGISVCSGFKGKSPNKTDEKERKKEGCPTCPAYI